MSESDCSSASSEDAVFIISEASSTFLRADAAHSASLWFSSICSWDGCWSCFDFENTFRFLDCLGNRCGKEALSPVLCVEDCDDGEDSVISIESVSSSGVSKNKAFWSYITLSLAGKIRAYFKLCNRSFRLTSMNVARAFEQPM